MDDVFGKDKVTDQRVNIPARVQPGAGAREARAQHPHQLGPCPPGLTGRYPGDGSRLRFCCLHTHMIAGRLPSCAQNPHTHHSSSDPNWRLPYQ
jgi:hypothetical protein